MLHLAAAAGAAAGAAAVAAEYYAGATTGHPGRGTVRAQLLAEAAAAAPLVLALVPTVVPESHAGGDPRALELLLVRHDHRLPTETETLRESQALNRCCCQQRMDPDHPLSQWTPWNGVIW